MMSNNSLKSPNDPDMRSSFAALERAAVRAHEVARRTGTSVIVMRDGVVVAEAPSLTWSAEVPEKPA
jgi:hypothetical protein